MQGMIQKIVGYVFNIVLNGKHHSKDVVADKVINLYQDGGFAGDFAKIRFWDAPYLEMEKMITKSGNIVDLGCGDGIFANFLALKSKNRNIFGVEISEERLKRADKGIPNTKFLVGDITKLNIPKADTILLVHVLHHLLSYPAQEELLYVIKTKLKKGGQLLIAEVEPSWSFKYLVTWFVDHFLVPWLFDKRFYSPIYFRKPKDWIKLFKKVGLTCKITSAAKNKPFTHILFDCKISS